MTDTSKEAVESVVRRLKEFSNPWAADVVQALAKERDELKADIVRYRARLLDDLKSAKKAEAEVERLRNLARRAKTWFDPYSPDRGQWLHDYKSCMQGKEGKSDG